MRAVAEPKYRERVIANSSTISRICNEKLNSNDAVIVFKTMMLDNLKFVFFTDWINVKLKEGVLENAVVK